MERCSFWKRLSASSRTFGGSRPARDRAGDLTPQRHPALVGDIALLGEAELADHGLEALRVERAVDALEIGIVEDHAHGLVVGLSEPEPPRFLVERRFRDGLLQHLAVEAEGAGLLHRQRAAELAADLLQPLGIDLAEFSVEISVWPTLASVDCPKPRKMSAMPQMPKLMIKTPITMAMMVLPSQFDEALRIPRSMGPTCLQEGTGFAQGKFAIEFRKRASPLIMHHKVAAAPSQPWRDGRLKRLTAGRPLARHLELAARALLAHV